MFNPAILGEVASGRRNGHGSHVGLKHGSRKLYTLQYGKRYGDQCK